MKYNLSTGLRTRCDAALEHLRRPPVTSRATIRHELMSTLRGSRLKPKRQKCVWKHKFYCLASVDCHTVPMKEYQKDALFTAGLGEKDIEFTDLDASADEFRAKIMEAYPKLRDAGGYQFLKCTANSRTLECLSTLTMSSPGMLKKRVGTARTYIRPLQRDLDITNDPVDISPSETVSLCYTMIHCIVL